MRIRCGKNKPYRALRTSRLPHLLISGVELDSKASPESVLAYLLNVAHTICITYIFHSLSWLRTVFEMPQAPTITTREGASGVPATSVVEKRVGASKNLQPWHSAKALQLNVAL
jgi:hypothetical protein